jgi:hypothetical protein
VACSRCVEAQLDGDFDEMLEGEARLRDASDCIRSVVLGVRWKLMTHGILELTVKRAITVISAGLVSHRHDLSNIRQRHEYHICIQEGSARLKDAHTSMLGDVFPSD